MVKLSWLLPHFKSRQSSWKVNGKKEQVKFFLPFSGPRAFDWSISCHACWILLHPSLVQLKNNSRGKSQKEKGKKKKLKVDPGGYSLPMRACVRLEPSSGHRRSMVQRVSTGLLVLRESLGEIVGGKTAGETSMRHSYWWLGHWEHWWGPPVHRVYCCAL